MGKRKEKSRPKLTTSDVESQDQDYPCKKQRNEKGSTTVVIPFLGTSMTPPKNQKKKR